MTGALLNSVTNIVKDDEAFVGVLRKAGKGADIAAVHEFGATILIRVTDKMRGFLFGVLFAGQPRKESSGKGGSSGGIIVVRIPARPFIRPTYAKWGPTSGERFLKNLSTLLGLDEAK